MSAALEFDEPGRPSAPLGNDAPTVIADTLRSHGIDAPASLYNEALNLAREGLLGPASQRLQMLVCLDPDDADGHLLLSKVYAAQGRAGEALARLEAAVEAGAVSPAGYREHLEGLIRTDRQKDEEHRARIAAREQGEIKALRQEARNLRSETIRLEAEVTETKDREALWRGAAMVAAGATAVAILSFGLVTLFRSPAPADVVPVADVAEAPVVVLGAADAPPVPEEIQAIVKANADAAAVAAPVVEAVKPASKVDIAKAAPTVPSDVHKVALPAAHVVVSGDTLYSLAGEYYNDKTKYTKIRDANKDVLKGGIALKLGMKLKIPK